MGSSLFIFPKTKRESQSRIPKKLAIRIKRGKACQPNHAPKAANNLKSPRPNPSLPVRILNIQKILQKTNSQPPLPKGLHPMKQKALWY